MNLSYDVFCSSRELRKQICYLFLEINDIDKKYFFYQICVEHVSSSFDVYTKQKRNVVRNGCRFAVSISLTFYN